MEIELRDLRYFLAVAQQESITKAAEYLFIAQPSLSRRMQKLESELKDIQQLVDRIPPEVLAELKRQQRHTRER